MNNKLGNGVNNKLAAWESELEAFLGDPGQGSKKRGSPWVQLKDKKKRGRKIKIVRVIIIIIKIIIIIIIEMIIPVIIKNHHHHHPNHKQQEQQEQQRTGGHPEPHSHVAPGWLGVQGQEKEVRRQQKLKERARLHGSVNRRESLELPKEDRKATPGDAHQHPARGKKKWEGEEGKKSQPSRPKSQTQSFYG